MKKIFVFTVLFLIVLISKAQQSQTPAAQVAHNIADKMKDSLSLTNQQRAQIFNINMDLNKQKTTARNSSQDRAVVTSELQKIESSRDSLYKAILTDAQYVLYRQKKRNLISSN